MPKSVYVICSRDGSVDKFTNSVSIYNIIEGFTIFDVEDSSEEREPTGTEAAWINLRITALWEREDDEMPGDYWHQMLVVTPEGQEHVISESPFSLRKQRRLFISKCSGLRPVSEGYIRAISRIRRRGEEGWIASGEYKIPIRRERTNEEHDVPAEPTGSN